MVTVASSAKIRRAVPIRGFVGANGSGKTLMAVTDLVPSLRAGRPVVSAVRLLDGDNLEGPCVNPLCDVEGHGLEGHKPSHPGWVPLRNLAQLLDLYGSDVLLDEVSAIVSSRDSASMPVQVATLLQQLRKRDLTLTWTAPAWARADKILREVTQLATICRGYGSRKMPDRLWRGRRLISAKSYNAADLDDFEAAKVTQGPTAARPRKVTGQMTRTVRLAVDWYDSWEEVPHLGFSSLSGTCVVCGGRRAAPRCSCPDH